MAARANDALFFPGIATDAATASRVAETSLAGHQASAPHPTPSAEAAFMQLTTGGRAITLPAGRYRLSEIRSLWKPGQCRIVAGNVTLMRFSVGGKGRSAAGEFELDAPAEVHLLGGYQVDASVKLQRWVE